MIMLVALQGVRLGLFVASCRDVAANPTLFIHCCILWHLQAVGSERGGKSLVMYPFHCKRSATLQQQASAWSRCGEAALELSSLSVLGHG